MNEPNQKNLLIVIVAVAAVGIVATAVVMLNDTGPQNVVGPDGTMMTPTIDPTTGEIVMVPVTGLDVTGLPPTPGEPVQLTVPVEPQLFASVVVDLYDPAKVLRAAKSNPWLADVMTTPLGRGYLGSWAGFFNTTGGDLGDAFKGTVFDLLADRLLAAPARVLWMGSERRRYTTVLVVPNANASAKAAFETFHRAAGRGEYFATGCPGSEAEQRIDIHRVVVADRAVYGTDHNGTIIFGRHPSAVLHGACASLPALERPDGVDFEIAVASDRFDRGVQSLLIFAGVSTTPRLAFGIEGDQLVPRGLRGEVKASRMPAATFDPAMLAAIPASTPFVLTMQAELPTALSVAALKSVLAGQAAAGATARQIAILWWPTGAPDVRKEELAVVWSDTGDEAALKKIFKGAKVERACAHLVISPTAVGVERVRAACSKKSPSFSNAAPAVMAGLAAKSSVTLGVDVGGLLNQLMLDAWDEEQTKNKKKGAARPSSVEAAAKKLEGLPFFGFTGTVDGQRLVPGGFRS